MKCIGLDLGSKTCGIALSDKYGMLARAFNTIRFEEDEYQIAVEAVVELIKKEKVEAVVLGYPKHMNGDVGIRAKISEDFRDKIIELIDIEVVLWDERLSSKEVDKLMTVANLSREKRKQLKDELAATVILQGYLDSRK